ncbi:hypothetical protein U4Y59_25835, partial [Escherichia coli]|nr:hypothetical protein [Escherichia coli]
GCNPTSSKFIHTWLRFGEIMRGSLSAWRQWLSHVTGPVVIDGDHFYPIQQARSFFTQIVRHFPHAFSAMTAWQKQPSTSER